MKNIKSLLSLTKSTLSNSAKSQFASYSFRNLALKSFSTIRLKTHQGTLEYKISNIENADSKLKTYLSKNWVLLKNSFKYNKIAKDSNFSNDQSETTLVTGIGKMTQVDFERFAVKTGLGLSNAENLFIEDVIFKGKKVRFVGDNAEDLARLNSIGEESAAFDEAEILVLLNNTENKEKRFVLYDKSKRIVLTNSQNIEKVKGVLEELSA